MHKKRKGYRYEKREITFRKGRRGQILIKHCWSCAVNLRPGDFFLQEFIVFSDGKEREGRIFCADAEKRCKDRAVEINSHGNSVY